MTHFKTIAALASVFVFAACGGKDNAAPASPAAAAAEAPAASEMLDIVAIAAGNSDFSTLVTALKEANLVEALQGDGPFTVFAPTNDAFAKLPEGALAQLLADKEKLAAVLKYHVVGGKVMAADVGNLTEATTLQGSTVAINTSDGVKIGAATVVKTDIEGSNGVIHVIDTVLIPQ